MEVVKTYISKANQGKFWFKISKQEQLPIQVLQVDVEKVLSDKLKKYRLKRHKKNNLGH